MGHHIVAWEEFYVHNNVVIYLERRKIVPEELLHPAYMYPSFNQISYSTDLIYISRRQVIQRSSQQIFRRGYETIHGLIMGHHIVACEEFYVHNNVVIYL